MAHRCWSTVTQLACAMHSRFVAGAVRQLWNVGIGIWLDVTARVATKLDEML